MASPKVWSRFTATKPDGTQLNLRIEECGEHRDAEIREFLLNSRFLGTEAFQKASGIPKNKDAILVCISVVEMLLNKDGCHLVVCCEDKPTTTPVIGISVMQLFTSSNKDDYKELMKIIKTPEIEKLFEIIATLEELHNDMEKLGLKKYYSGIGITVDPLYRKMGIANEFVRLRTEICKEHGAEAVGATMTAIGTQKAAEKYGWKTVYEINFAELGKMCGVEFVDVPVMCKKTVARV